MNFNFGKVLTRAWQITWTLTYMRLTRKPETMQAPVFAESDA